MMTSSISNSTRDGIGCSEHTRENPASWNEPKSKALLYGWIFHLNKTSKESSMYRLLSCTAVVICMALTPALAADDSSQAGAPDQSTGAKEQSSAPPASGAASDTKPMGEMKPSSGTWTPPRAQRSKARLLLAHLHRILLSPIPLWELRRNKQRTIDLRLKGGGARCRTPANPKSQR